MRLLFVALARSIHTVRWLSQLKDTGWDLHLFPAEDQRRVHPALGGVTVHHSVYAPQPEAGALAAQGVRFEGLRLPHDRLAGFAQRAYRRRQPDYRARQLAHLIDTLQPDAVHAMEFQAAGYLTLAAREYVQGRFPPLIVTNWGNDIYFFGRLKAHQDRIRALMQAADYYLCECERDIRLARDFGFTGEALGVYPVSSGFDLPRIAPLRQPGPASQRRTIALKGYQGWSGRALFALRALALCADAVRDYRIAIYAATDDVVMAAELLAHDTGLHIEIVPPTTHEGILRLLGESRMYIGVAATDGASTSSLEAMAMGAFPIQSGTACADERLIDGQTGFIVPPEDPHAIADAIRRAATDDALVDAGTQANLRYVAEHLDFERIRAEIVPLYERVVSVR